MWLQLRGLSYLLGMAEAEAGQEGICQATHFQADITVALTEPATHGPSI